MLRNPTQVTELKSGLMYVNVHSANFMNGEIRAQLLPGAVLRTGTLSATEAVPANSSPGNGRAVVALFPSGTRAAVSVTYSGLTGAATAGHVHGPAAMGQNAGILFDFHPPAAVAGSVVHAIWPITTTQAADLLAGANYADLHAGTSVDSEIRTQLLPPATERTPRRTCGPLDHLNVTYRPFARR